jgi:hypothetical protein
LKTSCQWRELRLAPEIFLHRFPSARAVDFVHLANQSTEFGTTLVNPFPFAEGTASSVQGCTLGCIFGPQIETGLYFLVVGIPIEVNVIRTVELKPKPFSRALHQYGVQKGIDHSEQWCLRYFMEMPSPAAFEAA